MSAAPPPRPAGPPAPPRAPALARWIATFAGSGYFPWAPATFASLIVALLYYLLPPLDLYVQFGFLLVVTWIAVVTATAAEKELGLDAHPIVIDEVAGMLVTYLLIPFPTSPLTRAFALFAGFVFFRFFDIVKVWPADRLQNLPGGRGIVADDLMAGVYSNLALRLLLFVGLRQWSGTQ